MSMPFKDPLAVEPDDTQQPLSDSAPYNDANENVVQSKSRHEKILEPEKMYDFVVCNHESNNEQKNRIYEEMEKLDLRGYIYDRDKIAGQYKLTAYEQAIRSTERIILLISTEALRCDEFSRKMHASSNFNVIPVYLDLPKKEYPRLLRHHFGIRYTNDAVFWDRLRIAITRPRNDSESSTEVGNRPKPKVVPVAPEKQFKKSPPSSKQKPEKEIPSIPMKTIRTKCEASDGEVMGKYTTVTMTRPLPDQQQSQQTRQNNTC